MQVLHFDKTGLNARADATGVKKQKTLQPTEHKLYVRAITQAIFP